MAGGSNTARELMTIAQLACQAVIRHFEDMPEEEFLTAFDGLDKHDLFNDVPTKLAWTRDRFIAWMRDRFIAERIVRCV